MEDKKIITLDLTGCKYLGEIHERIRTAFDFPEWYGANWDAFWDLLSTDSDADEVIVKGTKTLPDEFEPDVKALKKILEREIRFRKDIWGKYEDYQPFSYNIID